MTTPTKLSPNFTVKEFQCKCGCKICNVDPKLLDALEAIRAKFNRPIKITSGCRCPARNKAVGGAKDSQHITTKDRPCRAADIKIAGFTGQGIKDIIMEYRTSPLRPDLKAIHGIGLYADSPNMIHLDVRPGKLVEWRH